MGTRISRGATEARSNQAGPTSHERAMPNTIRVTGARGKPPLRAQWLEPTATAGLVSPVRRTKYTSW